MGWYGEEDCDGDTGEDHDAMWMCMCVCVYVYVYVCRRGGERREITLGIRT